MISQWCFSYIYYMYFCSYRVRLWSLVSIVTFVDIFDDIGLNVAKLSSKILYISWFFRRKFENTCKTCHIEMSWHLMWIHHLLFCKCCCCFVAEPPNCICKPCTDSRLCSKSRGDFITPRTHLWFTGRAFCRFSAICLELIANWQSWL